MLRNNACQLLQLCPTHCDPMDLTPQSMGFSRYYFWGGLSFPPLVENMKWSEVGQSCPALCGPVDCSLSGSSILSLTSRYWSGLPYLICESCFFALNILALNMSRYYLAYRINITPYDYHIPLRGYSIIYLFIVIPCAGCFQFYCYKITTLSINICLYFRLFP